MANWKGTLFFRSGDAGWTETIYIVTDQLAIAQVKLNAYADVRTQLLAGDSFIAAFRLSDDAVQGDSDLSIPTVPKQGKLGGDDSQADYPFAAFLVRMQSGLLYRRPLYIRGFPDAVTRPEGVAGIAIQQGFQRQMGRFTAFIASNGFYLKVISRDPGNAQVRIVALARPAPGDPHIQIITSGPIPGAAPNGLIRIYGATGILGSLGFAGQDLRGTRQITAIAGNTYTLDFTSDSILTDWNRKGSAKSFTYIFKEIDKAIPLRFTHHKAGRFFGQPVGRLPAGR